MQTLDIECKNINYSSSCSDSLDESKIVIKTGNIFINKAASNGARYMAFLQEDTVEVEVILQCMNLYSGTSIRKISDDIVYRQTLEQDETKNLKEMDNGIIKTLSNEAMGGVYSISLDFTNNPLPLACPSSEIENKIKIEFIGKNCTFCNWTINT